jgi:integrase
MGSDRPATEQQSDQVWEPEAVRIFLQRCAGHLLGVIFEVAVLTGLRRGELTGLRWSDVDLVARKITVRRNRVTVDGRITEQRAPA